MKALVSAEVPVTAAFYDIDPMRVVWHGNYVKYFELARCAVLERIGYSYSEMEASGYMWPVIDLRVKYVKPARLGQKLLCKAAISEYENRLKIEYEIVDADSGQRLTKGYSIQVAVCMEKDEMQLESPPVIFDKMSRWVRG